MHTIHQSDKQSSAFSEESEAKSGLRTMPPPTFHLHASGATDPTEEGPAEPKVLTGVDAELEPIEDLSQPVQEAGAMAPLQREESKDNKKKGKYVWLNIEVAEDMSGDEFVEMVHSRHLGHEEIQVRWHNIQQTYQPGSYRIKLALSLLLKARKFQNTARGIPTDEQGKVKGRKKRLQELGKSLAKGVKDQIKAEINRRYEQATGVTQGENWEPNRSERSLRKQIRDEVLAQYDFLSRLPEQKRNLIAPALDPKKETLTDLEKWFGLGKRLANLPPLEFKAFTQKSEFEAGDPASLTSALDKHDAKVQERKDQDQAREKVQGKLFGLKDIYQVFKQYKAINSIGVPDNVLGAAQAAQAIGERNRELIAKMEPVLKQHGFSGGVAEFEKYINEFRSSYEQKGVQLTLTYLDQYEELLAGEATKFSDPKQIKSLYEKLAVFRSEQKAHQKHQAELNGHLTAVPSFGASGPIGDVPRMEYRERHKEEIAAASSASKTAKANAEQQLASLGKEHPILREGHLPEGARISRRELAKASEQELAQLLQSHIAQKQKSLAEVRNRVLGKPELVYKMENLHPVFQNVMGFPKGGLCEEIIQDKKTEIENDEFVTSFMLGLAAIGIGVLTLGTGTPLSAGLLTAAGFGVSGYMAYQEYAQYVQEDQLSDVGLTKDPSLAWLVVALVGAGLDMGGVVKSVKLLGPAAKTIGTSGDLKQFQKALKQLQVEYKLSDEALDGISAAAKAQSASSKLREGTVRAIKEGGQLGAEKQEELIKHLARAKIKEGKTSYEALVKEMEEVWSLAGMKKLGPEDIGKSKSIWRQTREEIEDLKQRIRDRGEAERFKLEYDDGDLANLMTKGEELGLSSKEIEDFVFVGSRIDKRKSAEDMIEQMKNFKETIEPRGYPYLFESKGQFADFQGKVKQLCDEFGLPLDDIRVQGSSLRNPLAGDIDVVLVMKQDQFDSLVARIKEYRATVKVQKMANKSQEAKDGFASFIKKKNFQLDKEVAKGKLGCFHLDKIDGGKKPFLTRLYRILKDLTGKTRPKKIDFSIMSPEGKLNISPFLFFE